MSATIIWQGVIDVQYDDFAGSLPARVVKGNSGFVTQVLWKGETEWSEDHSEDEEIIELALEDLAKGASGGLDVLAGEIVEWQRKTFPNADPEKAAEAAAAHLESEVRELQRAIGEGYRPDIAEELADCLHLVFAIADRAGVDLGAATRKKFEVNKQRKWGAANPQGYREHVRDEDGDGPSFAEATAGEGGATLESGDPGADDAVPTPEGTGRYYGTEPRDV